MTKDDRRPDTSLERATRLVERSRQRIVRTIERVDRAITCAERNRARRGERKADRAEE
jgi:hypothetical protein